MLTDVYMAAGSHGVQGTNPMFGSNILDTSDYSPAQRRNPVWESQGRISPQGGDPNPLYGAGEEDVLASQDSLGNTQNPVWEPRGSISPQGGDPNPLFGSGVLDTSDSLTGENPLYETTRSRANLRRQHSRPQWQR